MTMITAKFLTTSRDDLFDMTQRLISAIDDDFLINPRKPVVICVNGSQTAGKRIVTDTALEFFFPRDCAMRGKENRDEYWTGLYRDAPLELDFIDAAYGRPEAYSDCINDPRIAAMDGFISLEDQHYQTICDFMSLRRHGGITILQNGLLQRNVNLIKIEIEARMGYRVDEQAELFLKERKSLCEAFERLHARDPWARFVRIEVCGSKILESKKFCDAFAAFAPACAYSPPQTGKEKLRDIFFTPQSAPVPPGCEPPVHVYGRNFPLPA